MQNKLNNKYNLNTSVNPFYFSYWVVESVGYIVTSLLASI